MIIYLHHNGTFLGLEPQNSKGREERPLPSDKNSGGIGFSGPIVRKGEMGGLVWGYALLFVLLTDLVKVRLYDHLIRKGEVGGGNSAQTLTPADPSKRSEQGEVQKFQWVPERRAYPHVKASPASCYETDGDLVPMLSSMRGRKVE